ncbi:hypothetical protein ONZ45_g4443 [Pleurotus djamor]|nr:hypothetical protein ONZ45_g4443 [Pleurotus djamor]
MSSQLTGTREEKVRKTLVDLRENPIGNDIDDKLLALIYDYLVKPESNTQSPEHWLCDQASSLTVEAATFLLRLHAYNSPPVDLWKAKLRACILGCSACVKGFELAKSDARLTYFNAFPSGILDNFFAELNKWQASVVVQELDNLSSTSNTPPTIPETLVYHMVSNLKNVQDHRIYGFLVSHPPKQRFSSWPMDPPPVGLLVLLMCADDGIRDWATQCMTSRARSPMTPEQFSGQYRDALDLAFSSIDSTSPTSTSILTADRDKLWKGFRLFLQQVPNEILSTAHSSNIRRLIFGHLHDTGPQFTSILQTFVLLMKRLGRDIWQNEPQDQPQIVLNALKENDSFLELLSSVDRPAWVLGIFSEFLHTTRGLPSYSRLLGMTADFLWDDRQDERFISTRPAILACMVKILDSAFQASLSVGGVSKLATNPRDAEYFEPVMDVLEARSKSLMSVAFDVAYAQSKWKEPRLGARKLVSSLLSEDIVTVKTWIRSLYGPPSKASHPTLRTLLWEHCYASFHMEDHAAITLLVELVSQLAHISLVDESAYGKYRSPDRARPISITSEDQRMVKSFNQHLSVIHAGMLATVNSYTSRYLSSSFDFGLFNTTDGAFTALLVMAFSPSTDIAQSSQYLISSAFNTDGQQACFRALLSEYFQPTVGAVTKYIQTFRKHVRTIGDACDTAISLVRCFTDISEVLFAPVDGMLRDASFLNKTRGEAGATAVYTLWSSMVSASCAIFNKAREWAPLHDSGIMIRWMRDAVFFGEDLVNHRGFIAHTTLHLRGIVDESVYRRQSADLRKKMIVNELQLFIPELAKWMRLTAEELLYQAYALLEAVLELFRDAYLPSKDNLTGLWKLLDSAKTKGLDASRLSPEQRLRLENRLSAFNEVVPVKPKQEPAPVPEPAPKRPATSKSTDTKAASKATPAPKQTIPPWAYLVQAFCQFRDSQLRWTNQPRTKPSEPKFEGSVKSSASSAHDSDSPGDDDEDDEDDGSSILDRNLPTRKSKYQRSTKVQRLDFHQTARRLPEPRNSAADSRRRLEPNVSKLYEKLLSWDYNDTSPELPLAQNEKPASVPNQFSDYQHYLRVFETLFYMECWANLAKAKQEPSDSYMCVVLEKGYVNTSVEVHARFPEPPPSSWRLTDLDLVVLQDPRIKRSVIAKVSKVTYNDKAGMVVSMLCCPPTGTANSLSINSTWQLSKVTSLSTMTREYGALVSVPFFDLSDTIIRPHLPELKTPSTKEVERAMANLGVNKPQATAILSSIATQGITLIQGPPGTGKTATICGLVKSYLSRLPQPIATPTNPQAPITQTGAAQPPITQKVLLCAPSNAAIDEVAKRIMDLFRGTNYRVVRTGADAAIGIATKDISLDSLVDNALLSGDDETKKIRAKIDSLYQDQNSVRAKLLEKQDEMSHKGDPNRVLEQEIQKLHLRRKALAQEIDAAKTLRQTKQRDAETARRQTRAHILAQAHVICTTLSGSGHELLRPCDFGMVIIDEAAQATELASLIPFRFSFNHCILVGDSQQLPPTVMSQKATSLYYNQSLFVRLQKKNPERVHLLSIQYRMHPEISRLPSELFYNGRLQDGPSMSQKTQRPWHSHPNFGVYRFFDVKGVEEQVRQSQKNTRESLVALKLFQALRRLYVSTNFTVGVVSMYKAQVTEIRRLFVDHYGQSISEEVDFNTVDGFQGQEKDVIILSCVRAGPGVNSIGFLADQRRMNVALTRAKSSVFILGNAPTLERSDDKWRAIIQNARSRSLLTTVDPSYFTSASPHAQAPPTTCSRSTVNT